MSNETHIRIAGDLASQFRTRADEADRHSKLPIEDIDALKSSGYLFLNIPKSFGGFGLSLRECAEAQLTLARGSASTALVAAMQLQVFGAALDCKTWTTGGRHLTHMLVKAMCNNEASVFLVEQNCPGIRWEETWKNALSVRASDSHDIYFENCQVPGENLIQPQPDPPFAKSPWFPMMLAAVYLESAIAARNAVIQYALERVPTALGKPIATLPKIQRQIGELDMPLRAARCLLLDTADTWNGNIARITTAKHFAVSVANDVTEKALLIAGGRALTSSLPLERYFRDVRAGQMQPPSGDTALEIIGKNAIDERGLETQNP